MKASAATQIRSALRLAPERGRGRPAAGGAGEGASNNAQAPLPHPLPAARGEGERRDARHTSPYMSATTAIRRVEGRRLVAPRRRRGVRLLFFQVAALPRFARERLVLEQLLRRFGVGAGREARQ